MTILSDINNIMRFPVHSKEYIAMSMIGDDFLERQKVAGKPIIARIAIQYLRQIRFGDEYIFRDLSDEDIGLLRHRIFVDKMGWYYT